MRDKIKIPVPGRIPALALVFGLLVCGITGAFAQSDPAPGAAASDKIDVTFHVFENDGTTPLVGAVVVLEGSTTKAAVVDLSGVAVLSSLPADAIVVISSIGFETQNVPVSGRTDIRVLMQTSTVDIGDVVVVGYGTQKKENVTGAVSMVSMDKVLGDRPVTSVGAALQGAVPGLVITGTAVPGAEMEFNIRGTTSINGGSPLMLIDNVPGDINMVNPQDIESISVLKDAASTAIYGARGAFGVILITTKKAAKGGAFSLNYNNNFAITKAINLPEQAPLRRILEAYQEYDNDGKFAAQSQSFDQWIEYLDQYQAGTLMQNHPNAYFKDGRFVPEGDNVYYYLTENNSITEMIDKFGFMQMHNLSASGSTDRINYRLSLGMVQEDGILITNKDRMTRMNVGAYISSDITPWMTTSLDMRYSRRNRSYVQNDGHIFQVTRSFYPTGMMPKSTDLDGPEYYVNTPANYLLNSDPTRWRDVNPRIYSRTSFRPLPGLEGIFEYTFDESFTDMKKYTKSFEMINDQMAIINSTETPTYRNDKTTTRYNSLNAYLTYDYLTANRKHNFKVMGGFSQERRYWESLWASRIDIINPDMPSLTGATGPTEAYDAFTDYTIRSGYFRLNYSFMDKYLFEANGRYDGSSKFPRDNRFGFFPSGSIGWQVAREDFMQWSRSWMNELKLRVSWGQVGNQAIDDYMFLPDMASTQADWIVDGKLPTTLDMPALVRTNFTWEKVETLDFGMDIALLNNRLQGTFDWYRRDTKGMLAPGMEFPAVVGADAPWQNVADLRTKGWELSVSWRDKKGDWGYGLGFNLFDSKTHITKYNNEAGLLGNGNYYTGMRLGEIWGYVTDGFYTIDDFQDGWQDGNWKLKDGVTTIRGNNDIRPGDVKFKNLRDDDRSINEIDPGDNTLENPGDQTVIGNNLPRYQYGINANVSWKNFELSMFFNGTGKRDYWLTGALIWPMDTGVWGTLYSHQLDYWRPVDIAAGNYNAQNPNAKYPRIYQEPNTKASNTRVQTKYLSNASFLRLKNITLSYTIPRQHVQKIGLAGAKVFFSAENVFTWSKLPKGYDPERLSWGYPFFATYSFGININL